jgi:uncharacterized membrane protein
MKKQVFQHRISVKASSSAMKKDSFLKRKSLTWAFCFLAFAGGIFFLNKSFTGNVILSDKYSFTFVSLIGMVLIILGLVMGLYSARKK